MYTVPLSITPYTFSYQLSGRHDGKK